MRHLVVTGAAGAIGAALTRGLAARHPRAHLSLVDRDGPGLDGLVAALDGRASAWRWDLAEPEALDARVAELVAARGPVDGLVNCAGIMDVGWFVTTDWTRGERLLAIDLVAPLRLMSLLVPGMLERGSGLVVNVSSMAGRTPLRGCAYYGAAKAGLAMASEVARLELEPRGVRVVTVYPGPVASALERGARAQLKATVFSRLAPVGDPEELARRVLDAAEGGQPRVVYPPLYAAANRILGLASWMTSRFSPEPS